MPHQDDDPERHTSVDPKRDLPTISVGENQHPVAMTRRQFLTTAFLAIGVPTESRPVHSGLDELAIVARPLEELKARVEHELSTIRPQGIHAT